MDTTIDVVYFHSVVAFLSLCVKASPSNVLVVVRANTGKSITYAFGGGLPLLIGFFIPRPYPISIDLCRSL